MSASQRKLDELFMMECLMIAQKGYGYVSPNPMVGAILVKNGKVIGRGYHKRFGGPHAEVMAIKAAKESVRGATLYVNLEPCNYYGKTPPCTDLIIRNGIKKVVIGCKDPNPLVSGSGIKQLHRSGINVVFGILEDESKKLNESFTKYITTGLPFVTLKIAQTLDGKIADRSGNSRWITDSTSRKLVHILRFHNDAVLVGAGTVNKDNPSLTVRDVKGRNPVRVIVDGSFTVNSNSSIFKTSETKTILFTSKKLVKRNLSKKEKLLKSGVEIIGMNSKADSHLHLKDILIILSARGIASLLVEGGSEIFSQFLNSRLADKLLIFIAPKVFGSGINVFEHLDDLNIKKNINVQNVSIMKLHSDILIEAYI